MTSHPPVIAAAWFLAVAAPLSAQARPDSALADSLRPAVKLAPVAVTATRLLRPVFRIPAPMLVVDSTVIHRELPDGVADLFRNLPGVDVTGVGPNQTRLMIRGQRGQRILLAEDGVRLNNSRRQQDFGELPAFSDVNALATVEVLRGPASVLYGTDAIGGMVNLLPLRPPAPGTRSGLHGGLLYRYGSASGQQLVQGTVLGRSGRVAMALTGSYRDAEPYFAPGGSFGALHLTDRTLVHDSGLTDRQFSGEMSVDLADYQSVWFRVSHYAARDAGFGFVDPADLGGGDGSTVRLRYPTQDVTRLSGGFRATALQWGIADRLGVLVHHGRNDREFTQDISIPFGAPFPPGAGISIDARNVTDISSSGARLELAKALGQRHLLTYGLDGYLEDSENADTSITVTRTFGPPTTRTSMSPTVPYARLWSAGLFGQATFGLTQRLSMGLGARAQTIHTRTRETPGLPDDRTGFSTTNQALVGALSATYLVIPEVNLVATLGRAFRAPNLVERYFEGAAEGSYQIPNPDLSPETSLNVDLGVKIRTGRVYAEAIWFRNRINDGIRAVAADTTVNGLEGFQNRNIETLTDRGLELLAEIQVGSGLSLLGHATWLTSRSDDDAPVGDGFASKLGGEARWEGLRNRLVLTYEVRHQGERDDVGFTNHPVGEVIPAFTVHNLRGAVRLPTVGGLSPQLTLAVLNLSDQLYSEASNTSFFRPEPRRSAVVGLRLGF